MDRASEVAMLRAVALERIGADHAGNELDEARAFAIASGSATREAEVEFYAGLSAFGCGNVEAARSACHRGLVVAGPANANALAESIPQAHVVARIEDLLGGTHVAEGRYDLQLYRTREAIAIFDECPVKDVWHEAFVIANLGVLARDFDLPDETALVAERHGRLAWTDDLQPTQFRTIEALSWTAMLRGDTIGALRRFRTAASLAKAAPEHIAVCVGRAVQARGLGHHEMAFEEIDFALGRAEEYDWNRAPGDTRDVLLALAQAAAPIAPQRARALLNRYHGIRSAMPGTFVARLEARVRAEEAYTAGVVLRAEGNVAASTSRLATAFETWQHIGYDWRASRAAIELAELDAGDVFRFAVRRELQMRPDSVFAQRARSIAA